MKWLERLRGEKKEQILILLLAGVLLLVIAIPTGGGTAVPERVNETGSVNHPAEETERGSTERTQEELLEEKLRKLLGQVEGIGRTEVMITLKSDGERIVEKDLERENSQEKMPDEGGAAGQSRISSKESTVYQKDAQGNEVPYVTKVVAPEIAGVLVIAQGGGNAVIANEITEAVMALFGVEAHKIKVMKME